MHPLSLTHRGETTVQVRQFRFHFFATPPSDYPVSYQNYLVGFTVFSLEQQAATRRIFDVVQTIINILFVPAVATVLIGKLPAAVVGDNAVCVGPPDAIVKGSATVMIDGRPAARVGDATAHGGSIVMGCPTVLIGG
jgi:uncharacterized Zn-binding protein involved in type VI secretion